MSTENTELSRTSVGDFLKLVGSELERASAFLSKAGSVPGAVPPAAQPTVPPAAPSKGVAQDGRRSPRVSLPACEPHNDQGTRTAVGSGAAASGPPPSNEPDSPAVVSRSASFVRFERPQQDGPADTQRAAPATAFKSPSALLPPMPPLKTLHLSQTTASSAPSGSSSSGSSSSGAAERQEGATELAQLLQLLAPHGSTAAEEAAHAASAAIPPLPAQDDGQREDSAAVGSALQPAGSLLDPALANQPCAQHDEAPQAALPGGLVPGLVAASGQGVRRPDSGQPPPAGSGCAGAGVPDAAAVDVAPLPRGKSHLKVLRWLQHSQAEAYSPGPLPPVAAAPPSNGQPSAVTARCRPAAPTGQLLLRSAAAPAGAAPPSPSHPVQHGMVHSIAGPLAACAAGAPPPSAGIHCCAADRVDYCAQAAANASRRALRPGSGLVRLGGAEPAGHPQGASPLKLLRPGAPRPWASQQPASAGQWSSREAGAAEAVSTALVPVEAGPLRLPAAPAWDGARPGITIGSIQTAYFGGAPGLPGATAAAVAAAAPYPGQAWNGCSLPCSTAGAAGAGARPGPEGSIPKRPGVGGREGAAATPDVWGAYLASRRAGIVQKRQEEGELQNLAPGEAVGQLRAISSRIQRMQGEITHFLSSKHGAVELLAPPSCAPVAAEAGALGCSTHQAAVPASRGGAAVSWAAACGAAAPAVAGAMQQGGAQAAALFDDDFVLSIKLGTDYPALQRQAAAAGAAAAAAAAQQDGGRASRPSSAGTDSTTGAGKGGAIDRLKGLRARRGAERVAYDTSVPVQRVGRQDRR